MTRAKILYQLKEPERREHKSFYTISIRRCIDGYHAMIIDRKGRVRATTLNYDNYGKALTIAQALAKKMLAETIYIEESDKHG